MNCSNSTYVCFKLNIAAKPVILAGYLEILTKHVDLNVLNEIKALLKSLSPLTLTILSHGELEEFELELLAKADKWRIPYDKHNPDFSKLEDDVSNYEYLIKQTCDLELNWDYNIYDPLGLEQAISDAEDREGCYAKSLRSDYYATRGVL